MGDNNVLYVRNEQTYNEAALARNESDIWDDTALILAYDHAVNLAKTEVEQRMNGAMDTHSASSSDKSFPTPALKTERTSKSHQHNKQRWSVGDACRCVFTDDGITYEADIVQIRHGGVCTVRYVGYDNEEVTHLNDLQSSHGPRAREKQKRDALQEVPVEMETSDCPDEEEPKVSKKSDNNRFVNSPHRDIDNEFPSSSRRSNQREYSRSRHSSGHGSNFQSLPRQHNMAMPQMMVPPPPPLNLLSAAGCPDDEAEALSAMLMSWYMSGFHTGYYQGMKQQPKSHYTASRRHK